jgi:nucleoside-diphosphate-sugar epimerase
MKIFITGTTGFIGRNVAEYYKEHEIFEYKRYTDILTGLLYFKPDLIINCAAEIYNVDLMWGSNIGLVYQLLEYMKEKGSNSQLIQIGSSAEYGPLPHPGSETDRINPVDIYQATKGSATLFCQGYARTYNLDISIARPYSVYGKYEKPHRLFPRLWKACTLNESIKLYSGFHDFINIDDFVRGIDILVQKKDKPLGDIVNFGSGIQYSNKDVLDAFEKITGKKAPVEIIDTMVKVYESDVWICNTTYAKEKYNFEVKYGLNDGIKKFLEEANYA